MTAHPHPRSFAALAAPLVLASALMLPGCATPNEVNLIVARSNAALLAGQVDLPDPGGTDARPAWQAASERIDTFIAAHPNQKSITAPLRIRQAMLLLSHGQFSLAQAAFNAVELWDLHTERDQALKRHQEILIWWFASSAKDTWSAADRNQARSALDQLAGVPSRLAHSSEIRDYLAEMRAWIGLSAARQTISTRQGRELVEDALDGYARIFTDADLAILESGKEQLPDPAALGPDARRRLRAKAVLDFARQVNQEDGLAARPGNEFFHQWINRDGL